MVSFVKNVKKAGAQEASEELSDGNKKQRRLLEKSLKPKAPRSTAPRTIIRIMFWLFILFILVRGIGSMLRGTQTVQEINIVGDTSTSISDSIKGFATDFSNEYFSWSSTGTNNRIERLSKFISGIDQDAGMKAYQVSGDSKVLAVELYDSKQIDDSHFEITTLVRREVTVKNASISSTDSFGANLSTDEGPSKTVLQKTYMTIPITITKDGPLIEQYPRFVVEQKKGSSVDENVGELSADGTLIAKASELTDSFLRTYLEGNVNQLKYFFQDDSSAPDTLTASDFTLNKVTQVQVYNVNSNDEDPYLRVEASVLVTNELGEIYTNQWVLNAVENTGKLYVKSIGYPAKDTAKELIEKAQSITAPSSTSAPSAQN